MLPLASMAGLATGCRFSAMGTARRTSRALLREPLLATTTSPEAAPSGTRATMNCSELMITAPSTSPKLTRGRRNSCGPRPLPRMRTSPPGNAQGGSTASMRGLPLTFFVAVLRSIMRFASASISADDPEMQQQLQDNKTVHARAEIIHHNSRPLGQLLQSSDRRRLHNVEHSEKYKAGEQRPPHDGTRHQREQL